MEKLPDRILWFLIYFNLFAYPLTREELASYLGLESDQMPALDDALDWLVNQGLVGHNKGFYFVGSDPGLVERRIDGNMRWAARIVTAKRYSAIISAFPYVRGVFLSGSISKGFIGESDDIDYFIITSPGRLWFVRTLLTLFKKIFLLNSRKNFCINYFVDTENLAFQERNLYAATEIVSLIPTYNPQLYSEIIGANHWLRNYYPTYRQNGKYVLKSKPVVKKLIEPLFNNRLGDHIEAKLFQMSKRVIRNKYSYMNPEEFSTSFSLEKHEIRYFPNHANMKIMERFQKQLKVYSSSNHLQLTDLPSKP
jgi:hypothetical protein